VEFETQIGRQDEPVGDLLLLPSRGHGIGQAGQQVFLETALEEIPLIGLADDFQAVELPLTEGGQDLLGLVFDESQVHSGQSTRWDSAS
jgi:hypothetical protein